MATAPGIIEQRILAGSQFSGVAGVGVPTDADGIRRFAPAVAGGLFSFDFASQAGSFESYIIEQIIVDFADAVSAKVNILTAGGPTVELASPGAGVYLLRGPVELGWDQQIQLVTVGATGAMVARLVAKPGRVRPAS